MVAIGPEAQGNPAIEPCPMAKEGPKYECLADIMTNRPDYKGYFMYYFDVSIGPWNFIRFDP